ncbi:MAG: phage scaffolding protein [Bacillota bacterium]
MDNIKKIWPINLQLFNEGGGAGSGSGGAGGQGSAGAGSGSGKQGGSGSGNGQAGTGQGQGGDGQGPKVFSEEYVSAIRNESAHYRTQLRGLENAVRGALGLKAEDQVSEAVISQYVQQQKQAIEKSQASAKKMLIKAEVKMQAVELKIIDPDAAMALADLSKVQVAEDGKVTGVKEALEALIKDKPYLVGKGSGGVGSPGSPGGGQGSMTPEEEGRKIAEERAKAKKAQLEGKGIDPWA